MRRLQLIGCFLTKTTALFCASLSWNGSSPTWEANASWDPTTGFPNAIDDIAIFSNASGGSQPILGINVAVGQIQFKTATHAVTGAGDLTFETSSGNAAITALASGCSITNGLALESPLNTTVSQDITLTLSGVIGGTNPLTIGGEGTTLLNGVNTYTGGVTVDTGTLQIAADSGLGNTAQGVTLSSGTLQTSANITTPSTRSFTLSTSGTLNPTANTLTVAGVIGGDALIKTGPGTLSLTNTNTYTGNTTVSAGTLIIASNDSLGATGGSLLLGGATLQVASLTLPSSRAIQLTGAGVIDVTAGTVTIEGPITGTGFLEKTSAGTLVLSGVNTYSGNTTVSAGILQGTTDSLQGVIDISAGTLSFNQSTSGTYAGALSGGGNLMIAGSGPITMTGSSTFSGTATIDSSAELIMDGALGGSSAVTVNAGGTLKGSGSVGSIANSGTVSPGNSGEGTLSVSGALTTAGGSALDISFNGTKSGVLSVGGNANITNTDLTVTPASAGTFFGVTQDYTIINAGSVTGPFASASATDSQFSVTVIQDTVSPIIIRIETLMPFASISYENRNERAVGQNLDAITTAGTLSTDLTNVINALSNQSNEAVNEALNQMHPAAFSAFAEIQTELGGALLNTFHRFPSLGCRCTQKDRIWFEPLGNWLQQKHRRMQIGFHNTSYGFAFGYDREILEGLSAGIGAAWNRSSLHWSDHRGHAHINGFYGALYTDFVVDQFYVGGSVYAGVDWYHTVRDIKFTSIDRKAKADMSGLDLGLQFTSAYLFGSPSCFLYPYATLDYLHMDRGDFKESGADSLNLKGDAYSSGTLRFETGGAIRFMDRNPQRTLCIAPLFSIGYVFEKPIYRKSFISRFQGQSTPFTTYGWDKTWNLLSLRFGLQLSYHCVTLDSDYIAEISPAGNSPLINQRANFRLSYTF